ncbi:MAG: hypothetical protein NC250_04470 [Alistipes senegalensis]|nr:hypothetical protein [Bacteroides cellulosilyticus]MCM1351967.1 hypothetical protein [Alistipes senegalensis]
MDILDFIGNRELLDADSSVGFFASRRVAPAVAAECRDWAENLCLTEPHKVVISGFHSPLEQELFRIFLKYRQPVVWALGRSIHRRLEPDVFRAVEQRFCLVVSVADGTSHTRDSALARNRFVAEMARENFFAEFAPGSGLEFLYDWSAERKKTIIIR